MERLTFTDEEMERIETECPVKNDYHIDRFCDNVCDEFQYNCPFMKMAQKLKTYEDKEEQGLLIELPCPRGTKVYFLNYEENDDFGEYTICSGIFHYSWLDFPREFYLTRSEAEEALAKMNGEDA